MGTCVEGLVWVCKGKVVLSLHCVHLKVTDEIGSMVCGETKLCGSSTNIVIEEGREQSQRAA